MGPSHSDAAVVDVGSNSVRLVLYRIEGRTVWTVYNEKVLAGLGRGLSSTGRLNPEGIAAALMALKRFRALIDASRPDQIYVVGTAAVRDALDGPAFVQNARDHCGLNLRVLTGAQEAHYAALGVVDGAPGSTGLVGDLGGASLELARITDGWPEQGLTLPLGPFALTPMTVFDPDHIRSAVATQLRPYRDQLVAETLNVVGGAWRNLALLHMRLCDYPLEILHQFEIPRREALETLRFVSQQSRGSLEGIDGISRRRVDALPHAAVVLEALIEQLELRTIKVSAYGLREGLLFEAMTPAVRKTDPLIDGCAALGGRHGVAEALGAALQTWLQPAFSTLEPRFAGRDATLVAAACRLADLGAQLHPDHRANLVFEQVLRSPIPGMTHPERAFLACAVFGRHTASTAIPGAQIIERLLSSERYQRARALGAAIRLGCDLSGRSPELLEHARLDLTERTVHLRPEIEWIPILLSEQTRKRAATLANLLGRQLKIRAVS